MKRFRLSLGKSGPLFFRQAEKPRKINDSIVLADSGPLQFLFKNPRKIKGFDLLVGFRGLFSGQAKNPCKTNDFEVPEKSGPLFSGSTKKPRKTKGFEPLADSGPWSLSRTLIASVALIALVSVSCGEASKPADVSAGKASDELVAPVEVDSEVNDTETTTDETGPGTGETGSQNRAIQASTGYKPVKDGFGFENFGGGEAPAELTVNMTRRFYGDNQVCSDVTNNECTPYPVILQLIAQANRSMQGGLCEGLTVLSLRLANDLKALTGFQDVEDVASLIKEDPALLSEIAYWYVTQFAIEVQQEAAQFLELSPLALARILYEDFAKAEAGEPSVGYTMGIYSEQGGHAVTPYKVETNGDIWRIYIYDSNWPTAERWIDVNEDGWSYALAATNPTEKAEAWSGGTGTMELTPMTIRNGPFTCAFCPSDKEEKSGTLLTVAASGSKQMALQIETPEGNRLGYYDGSFVNEIEGATYRYLISGPSTADPVMVFLPPGIDDFSADVDVIDVPTPGDSSSSVQSSPSIPQESEVSIPPEQEPITENITQQFSLLILDEEKSVQIEAEVIEEEPISAEITGEPEIAESLINFSEESVEIADIEEATVAIAVDALEVEIDVEQGQQVAVQFVPEPPPVVEAGQPEPVVEAPAMLDISIADDTGEVLAEVEIDLTPFRVEDRQEEIELEEEPEQAPIVLAISFDEEIGEIEQVEESIEAWVASDAEYFQAIVEDRLDEVLGEIYVEELEEREEWELPEEFFEEEFDLLDTLLAVEEEYWEDEHWEEIEYDEEWFEEIELAEIELFGVYEEEEWWDEEEWIEEDEWFEEIWIEEEWIEEQFDPEQLFERFEEQENEELLEEIFDEFEEFEFEEEWEEELLEEEWWLEEPEGLPESFEEIDFEEEWEEEWNELPPTTTWMEEWDFDEFGEIPEDMLEWSDEDFDLFETFLDNTTEEEELEVWEEDPFLNTEEEWDEWEDEFWFEDSEIEDDWIEDWVEEEEEIEEEEETPPLEEEEWESNTEEEVDDFEDILEEEWDNPYADCIGTSACADAPAGFDTWAQWESANNPNYVEPEVGDPDYVPPPPPPPAPVYWAYSNDLVTSRISTASESTVTTVLARGEDGHWYETHTTETTTTTTTYTTNGTEQFGCVDNACASSGTTWDDETSEQAVAVTTSSTVVPASCSQGGWTGLGDWCIVDSSSRNDYDHVAFSVPTAAEENEACDCTDGDGLMDIRIDAESNLTGAQFNSNNEHADPYIYLNHDTDSDDGDHSGDMDAITVGNQIAYNDDGGRDCGNTCNNPPSTATDPDETPNVTLSNGEPVINNVRDSWDSRITRELSAGDYVVRASVYNNANSGWYRLTIRDADVTYP